MRNSKWISRIAGILAFVLIVSVSMWWLNQVLVIKRTDGITTMQNLYAQPSDTCDVLLLGSSHTGMNLDAEQLWSEYGIAAYSLWGSVQPFWNSYYFLLESLEHQSPELVVLDVYAATFSMDYSDDARQETNTMGMQFGMNKLNAIFASAPKERWTDMILEFPLYHSRISELTANDFAHFPWTEGLENEKGTGYRYGVGNYTVEDPAEVTQTAQIHAKEEKYLRKIIETCLRQEIPLLLIKTPVVSRNSQQSFYNSVSQIANEYGIPFVNFNLMDSLTGICEADIWQDGHLNTNGARKISSWLGAYIKNNYDIVDRRGDERYASWEVFSQRIRDNYLKTITSTEDYFNELIRNNYSVLIIKNSSWEETAESNAVIEAMAKFGIDVERIRNSGGGDWMLTNADGGELIGQPIQDLYSDFEFDGMPFHVSFKDATGVQINGEIVYTLSSKGIIFVVYDQEENVCKDVVTWLLKDDFTLKRP